MKSTQLVFGVFSYLEPSNSYIYNKEIIKLAFCKAAQENPLFNKYLKFDVLDSKVHCEPLDFVIEFLDTHVMTFRPDTNKELQVFSPFPSLARQFKKEEYKQYEDSISKVAEKFTSLMKEELDKKRMEEHDD